MFKAIVYVGGVIGAVTLGILIWILFSPVNQDLIQTANASLAEHDLSQYPGAQSYILWSPWMFLWSIPVIGIGVIVLYLRKRMTDRNG